MFGKLFKFITKLVLLIGLVAIAIPAGFLAWRMGQPMYLPEFKGLTYYEYLDWREQEFTKLAEQYQAQYPDKEVKEGMCNNTGLVVVTYVGIPSVGLRAALSKPEWDSFLTTWWSAYEGALLLTLRNHPHQAVPYCRIAGVIPDDYIASIR